MLFHERFKPVPGFDGDYWVTDTGQVVSLKRAQPHLMKVREMYGGWHWVQLSKNGKTSARCVERLVARLFHGIVLEKPLHDFRRQMCIFAGSPPRYDLRWNGKLMRRA